MLSSLLVASFCLDLGAGDQMDKTGKDVLVAPVFEHGVGRGSSGGISIYPENFLPEGEALQIIAEELTTGGLELTDRSAALRDFKVMERCIKDEGGKRAAFLGWDDRPIVADFLDRRHRIAIEYISLKSYFERGGPNSTYKVIVKDKDGNITGTSWHGSSDQGYDMKETAHYLAYSLKGQGKGVLSFGVFYDPLADLRASPVRLRLREGTDEEVLAKFDSDYAEFRKTHDRYPPRKPSMEGLDEAAKKKAEVKFNAEWKEWNERMEKLSIEESRRLLRL